MHRVCKKVRTRAEMIKLGLGNGCEGKKQEMTLRYIWKKNGRHLSVGSDGNKREDRREWHPCLVAHGMGSKAFSVHRSLG